MKVKKPMNGFKVSIRTQLSEECYIEEVLGFKGSLEEVVGKVLKLIKLDSRIVPEHVSIKPYHKKEES